jgi:chemotaxis protein methyltransferase CheR
VTELAQITELLRRETGIVVPPERAGALRAAVDRATPGLGPAAFLAQVADPGGGELLGRLIDEVTTRETTFSRDRGQLDTIGWPDLLRSARAAGSRTIRVWSAGCASGEEPYTLALLAHEAFGARQPPVDVLGTDISSAALAAAAAGRYRERAIRALAQPDRDRYLDRHADGSYEPGERLRRLVRFRRHNLVRDRIPPAGEAGFDLVVCRNVLIYFEEWQAARVIEALRQALRPGGLLLLGAADALQLTTASTLVPGSGRRYRRPLRPDPVRPREERLAAALQAAGQGDRDAALAQVESLLSEDPLDADAHFVRGLVALEAGEPARAVAALRRALYADATFALAAFTIGRAYDALGDATAACRAFEQALRTLDPEDHRHESILRQVDLGDIAAACRARLASQPGRVRIT